MTYQEEERTRQKRNASKHAIALAMQGWWREAIAANKSLLENFPDDVDTYNRLGRAHMELGEYALAREAYQKSLELDAYNNIAKKNLDRLSHLRETEVGQGSEFQKVEPQQFIEEVGKAGVVRLYNLAPPETLAKTVAGSRVNLKVQGPSLVVENNLGEYLGQVDPKHGQRLIRLMDGGNKYSASVVSSTKEAVSVMIREVYRDPSQAGRLSFPLKGTGTERAYVGSRIGDIIIRRGLEYEESLPGQSSYTIIGGDEAELLSDEPEEDEEDEDDMNEE